jgi:uncharacterized protein HemX
MIVDRSSINKTAAELASTPSESTPSATSNSNETMASTTSVVSPTAPATLSSENGKTPDSAANGTSFANSDVLPTGTLAGIVVGSLVGFVLIVGAAILIVRRWQRERQRRAEEAMDNPYEHNPVTTEEVPMIPGTREEEVFKEIGPRFEKDGQPVAIPTIHEMA